jgi:DNA-binding phage protein
MKKIVFAVVTFLTAVFAQKGMAQDSTQQRQLYQLLSQYYNIKDALIAANGNDASAKAGEFIKTANSIDYKLISEGNINALLKDATSISETKDIKKQREHFANFSNNMAMLAKSVKLGTQPIYQAYCPMKKANWLSSEKEIKNPYYGSTMLTCGNVVERINQ